MSTQAEQRMVAAGKHLDAGQPAHQRSPQQPAVKVEAAGPLLGGCPEPGAGPLGAQRAGVPPAKAARADAQPPAPQHGAQPAPACAPVDGAAGCGAAGGAAPRCEHSSEKSSQGRVPKRAFCAVSDSSGGGASSSVVRSQQPAGSAPGSPWASRCAPVGAPTCPARLSQRQQSVSSALVSVDERRARVLLRSWWCLERVCRKRQCGLPCFPDLPELCARAGVSRYITVRAHSCELAA